MYYAVFNRNLPLVQQLVEQGANVNEDIGTDDTSILLTAIQWNNVNFQIVQYLVEHGADVNFAARRDGITSHDLGYDADINTLVAASETRR